MNWDNYISIPNIVSISRNEVENFLLNLNIHSKALDVGCGFGRISKFLKENGFEVIAIDNNKKMVKHTRDLGIDAFYCDARHITLPNKCFDIAITDGLLEHYKIEDVNRILEQMNRVSKCVVNFIPKDTFINKILEVIQQTPKTYWRNLDLWERFHYGYFENVKVSQLTRLNVFVCDNNV